MILLNGFHINNANKYIYRKFDEINGIIICLYVSNILIFGANLEYVTKTKNFLSTSFEL